MITDQIRERERQKLLMLEAKEQENLAMKATMKKYEEEDAAKAARRQVEVRTRLASTYYPPVSSRVVADVSVRPVPLSVACA